jgi:RimJ/RimL family protein N-acetyltransferase
VTAHPPFLPDLHLPLQAATRRAETVRIRPLAADDVRVQTASEYDDWGPFDIEFDDSAHGRAMIEILLGDGDGAAWWPVGDMSWHAEFHGPNLASRAISIGLALHVEARGRGIGTVAQSLLATALHRAGVHRVQASTDPANATEQRALANAGFVREGVARGAQVRADGRHDLVLYSCLPGEPRILPD